MLFFLFPSFLRKTNGCGRECEERDGGPGRLAQERQGCYFILFFFILFFPLFFTVLYLINIYYRKCHFHWVLLGIFSDSFYYSLTSSIYLLYFFCEPFSYFFFFLVGTKDPISIPLLDPIRKRAEKKPEGASLIFIYLVFFLSLPHGDAVRDCVFLRASLVAAVVWSHASWSSCGRSRAVGCHLWFRVYTFWARCVNAKINIATFRANRAALSRALFCVEVQRFVRCGAGSLTIHFRSLALPLSLSRPDPSVGPLSQPGPWRSSGCRRRGCAEEARQGLQRGPG